MLSEVESGTASYVTTGAALPRGADAVVKVEDTERILSVEDGREKVKIKVSSKPGASVRKRGFDIEEGQVVIQAGEVVLPYLNPTLKKPNPNSKIP